MAILICLHFTFDSLSTTKAELISYNTDRAAHKSRLYSILLFTENIYCPLYYNAGGLGSVPGSGRSPGEGNGNPLQYSCLENPKDRGAWQTTVHRVTKSQTQLSD